MLSLLTLALLTNCAAPPPSAYVSSRKHAKPGAGVSLGTNSAGEACTQDGHPGDAEASVYCGSWQQPSARVVENSQSVRDLQQVASVSSWRDGLDRRFECAAPVAGTILGHDPAMVLTCTTRTGGWPEVAIAAQAGGHVWLADGVRPALPAIERSIGILSGEVAPGAAASQQVSAGLAAQRVAAQVFSSSDIGEYNNDLRTATQANGSGDYAEAERLYRAMAALQERILGHDAPAISTTLSAEALQLSDQGEFAAADKVFDRAARLAAMPNQTDSAARAVLLHYRALHLRNEQHPEQALAMLSQAEAAYGALLAPGSLTTKTAATTGSRFEEALNNSALLTDQSEDRALAGVIETRRARAVTLRLLGRTAESATAAQSAASLADARGITASRLVARLYRTSALIAQQQGRQDQALAGFSQSAEAYATAVPNSRTYAETNLLWAGQLIRAGRIPEALTTCRTAATVLRLAGAGTTSELLQPCLTTLLEESKRDVAHAQALYAEMFAIAQLSQTSITSQQIAETSERLTENSHDPKIANLMKKKGDQNTKLAALYEQRDEDKASAHGQAPVDADLAKQIDGLIADEADTEKNLQAADPNLGQLTQKVVGAPEVFAAMHPGEAFAAVILGFDTGWTFALRDGKITVAPVEGGSKTVAALVSQVRKSMDAETEPPPPFDIAADQALYTAVLGGVAPALKGATALSVAPSGPMLALPFGVLLSGPAAQDDLAHAPWLVRQYAIEHVPAPANFVQLRKLAGTSRASQPWFGFGEFHPVTLAQAERSYPIAACGDSAQLLAALPPLPGAVVELEAVRRLTGGSPADELVGPAFTAAAVQKAALKTYRVLHFATHALLPTDLRCQVEPALITSSPPGAIDASGALLTSSDVVTMDLDADAVILSACNTGGPSGTLSGESLTGLARSFFHAGARALLVTHWSVNDRTTAYLVALSLQGSSKDRSLGLAGALANAQRRMLDDAKGDLAAQAHPFYWAALAVIGEGMGDRGAKLAGL